MVYLLQGILYFLIAYQYTIFLFVLMTWFPNFRGSALFRLLYKVVEPYLGRFRRIIPPIGGLDFSPIIGFMLLSFAIRGFQTLLASGSF
jgi:YggT family protein